MVFIYTPGFLIVSTIDIPGWKILCCGDFPVHCWIFSSMSGLYPEGARNSLSSQLWQPSTSLDIDRCFLPVMIPLPLRSTALYRYCPGCCPWSFHLPSSCKVFLAIALCPEDTFDFLKGNTGENIFKIYKTKKIMENREILMIWWVRALKTPGIYNWAHFTDVQIALLSMTSLTPGSKNAAARTSGWDDDQRPGL